MKEVCQNCQYFVRMSPSPGLHLWGDCRKPASGTEQTNGDEKAVFKWGQGTCSDFKPKQEAEKTGLCI